MAYLSTLAVNLVQNFVTICTIPLCVQLLFALLYAVQSDILPIFEGLPSNPVLKYAVVSTYICPIAGILLMTFGISYQMFYGTSPSFILEDKSLGYDLIAVGAAIVV